MMYARGGVGVGVLWLVVWLSRWPPFNLIIPVAGEDIHCVQVGQAMKANFAQIRHFSIGGGPFEPIHWRSFGNATYHAADGLHFTGCANSGNYECNWVGSKATCASGGWTYKRKGVDESSGYAWPHLDFCESGHTIRTYLVHQNGRVLRGWLHFEVEYTGDSKGMEFIYAQMRDEQFNAVGEIVTDEKEHCDWTSDSELVSPTKYQILPCSATSPREPKNPNAIFMAKPAEYVNLTMAKDYLTLKPLHKGIHFTWRLNEYWCNRHEKFRLEVQFLPSSNITKTVAGCYVRDTGKFIDFCRPRRATTFWIFPEWFGAADIKLEGPLSCSTLAMNPNTGSLSQDAKVWIKEARDVTVGSDYVANKTYALCQQSSGQSFGGRCATSTSVSGSKDQPQTCQTQNGPPEFPSYTEYKDKLLENRSILCSQECKMPDITRPRDLIDIQSFPKKNTSSEKAKATISYTTLRNARTEQRANVLFYTRKFHGNLCIFFTMGLLSISNLLIRYYKETFMHNLALGCAPWFWVHMAACFWVLVLYHSGQASMQQTIDNFGVSKSPHATFHRGAGYVFIIAFYLSILLGAFRPLIRGARIISMAIHSVIGFLLYLLAMILIISSTFIPASPSAKLDECDEDGNLPSGWSLSFTAWMAIGWLAIDFCFHIFLTVFQFAIDKKYEIVRGGFGLPIVPMLPAESSRDLVGSRFRKLVLLVYIILSVGMTFTTMSAMFVNDNQGKCSLGTMSCNLDEVEPNKDSSPFGCSPISIKYYGKVILKYSAKQ